MMCSTQSLIRWKTTHAKERLLWLAPIESIPLFNNQDFWLFAQTNKNLCTWLYGNVTWSTKWLEGYPLLLWLFFCQIISITLQKIQTSSILTQEITIGLATFELPPFQDPPPIPTIDLLQASNQMRKFISIFVYEI